VETKIEVQSPFLDAVGDRYLTPEWAALAPGIDHYRGNHPKSILASETTADFAVFSSERVLRFGRFQEMPLGGGLITKKFVGHLVDRQLSYRDLTGLHGVEGREDAFRGLEKDLKRYVIGFEQNLFDNDYRFSHPQYDPWYKRLWANVCEELGTHTGNIDLIGKSLILNESVAYDRSIEDRKSYKIHAKFSKFDVAEELYGETRQLKNLNLPTSYKGLQCEFYDRLFHMTKQLTHYDKQELATCQGVIAELLLIGFLRDSHLVSGEHERFGVRQGYIHQDSGNTNRKDRDTDEKLIDDEIKNINSSFDLIVFDRLTGEKVNIDAKKGSQKSVGGLAPNIINIYFNHNGLSPKGLVKAAHKIARIRKRQLAGTKISRDERNYVENFFSKLDYSERLKSYRERLGKAVLEVTT